ncbi:MAG: aminotransferase class V-fold PLP-dependent enzyme [Synergistaceae bacterium]|jgi:cysteine desulfurase family protein|nr:aminotransferase class V-fold PLP-dependent enzyme [Synergistaceae bacterium]
MRQIYANYAATSPRVSPAVADALVAHLRGTNLSAGRNFEGLDDCAVALRARSALAELFGVSDPTRVLFTSGATAALNMALNGLLRPGDHVLATSVEHNAVARPLELLSRGGIINVEWLPCSPEGSLDPAIIHRAVRQNTRMLVMPHASNVLGTILPVGECLAIAEEYGLLTVLDVAQTAGVLPLPMDADVLTFAGHKGLRGLPGIGGFAVSERAVAEMEPWFVGGTGSSSQSLDMPDFLPDRFEPGTQNTPGILSLAVSAAEILETGTDSIREREAALTARFIDELRRIPGIVIHGTGDASRSVAVVSVSAPGHDSGKLARRLHEEHGIITRSGLHCSPLAHRTAGTFPGGTLRFSFGAETTEDEINEIKSALRELLKGAMLFGLS